MYEERWKDNKDVNGDSNRADAALETGESKLGSSNPLTEWVVIAEAENAHDVFEVNNVVWATRADKGRRFEDEEVVITTGDDGEVKVWVLNE